MSSSNSETRHIFILDYDDTLLPTSYLMTLQSSEKFGERVRPPGINEGLIAMLQDSIVRLLRSCQEKGEVVIISNGKELWIEMTCADILPHVHEYIRRTNIIVISAQDRFKEGNEMTEWKKLANRSYITEFKQRHNLDANRLEVLSVGDNLDDYSAAFKLSEHPNESWYIPRERLRFVRFKELPNLSEVVAQVHALQLRLPEILALPGPVKTTIKLLKDQFPDLHGSSQAGPSNSRTSSGIP